jgi:hypothetical protein
MTEMAHAACVYCGSPECTCLDTDEEYLEAAREAEARRTPAPIKAKRWFLSYAYRLTIDGRREDELHYGSAVVEGSEHPVDKVARWNREITYRRHVLLWFCELGEGAPGSDFDAEI